MNINKWNSFFTRGILLIIICACIALVVHYPISAQKLPAITSTRLKNFPDQQNLPYKIYLPTTLKTCVCYFIDSNSGSDSNPGNQPEKPWRTLSKLGAANLQPGTIVFLKRGSIWAERVRLYASGQAGKPVTITAYGSGAAPILSNPGDTDNNESILNIYGKYVVIENLKFQDSGRGINIFSDHNIVQNSEVTNTGIGIELLGQYNLVTGNYIHDTRMIVNTPGGDNDDFGANGVNIGNAYNEVSFNLFVNCEAPSYDYGLSGGATEIYGEGDYLSIHHNRSYNSAGFIEVGGNGTGTANNVTIFYNLIVNSTNFTYIHLSGRHAIEVHNFRVENNTLIDLRAHNPWIGNYIGFNGNPLPDTYFLRNNIIYITDYWSVSNYSSPITHQNNLYYFINGRNKLGFTPDPSELLWVDPQFVNIAGNDFHLKSTSPAKKAGINLGYTSDLELNPVPVNTVPDLGAFEYQGN